MMRIAAQLCLFCALASFSGAAAAPAPKTRGNPQPGSTLTVEHAEAVAQGCAAGLSVATGRTFNVVPLSGISMRPTNGDRAFAVVEVISPEALGIGDYGVFGGVAHRVHKIKDGRIYTKGDNNFFADRGSFGPEDFRGRIVGLIYVSPSAPRSRG